MDKFEERQELIISATNKIKDDLLSKLFNINIALSAFYIAIYSFSDLVKINKHFLALPFINLAILILKDLILIDTMAAAFNKLDEKREINTINTRIKIYAQRFLVLFVILSSIFLVIVLLFVIFRDLK